MSIFTAVKPPTTGDLGAKMVLPPISVVAPLPSWMQQPQSDYIGEIYDCDDEDPQVSRAIREIFDRYLRQYRTRNGESVQTLNDPAHISEVYNTLSSDPEYSEQLAVWIEQVGILADIANDHQKGLQTIVRLTQYPEGREEVQFNVSYAEVDRRLNVKIVTNIDGQTFYIVEESVQDLGNSTRFVYSIYENPPYHYITANGVVLANRTLQQPIGQTVSTVHKEGFGESSVTLRHLDVYNMDEDLSDDRFRFGHPFGMWTDPFFKVQMGEFSLAVEYSLGSDGNNIYNTQKLLIKVPESYTQIVAEYEKLSKRYERFRVALDDIDKRGLTVRAQKRKKSLENRVAELVTQMSVLESELRRIIQEEMSKNISLAHRIFASKGSSTEQLEWAYKVLNMGLGLTHKNIPLSFDQRVQHFVRKLGLSREESEKQAEINAGLTPVDILSGAYI